MYADISTLNLLQIDAEDSLRSGLLTKVDAMSVSVLASLSTHLEVVVGELSSIARISKSACRRYLIIGGDLHPEHADAVLRVARMLLEARRTFRDDEKALRWLKTKHPLFAAKPIDLIGCDAGAHAVSEELIRIGFGDLA